MFAKFFKSRLFFISELLLIALISFSFAGIIHKKKALEAEIQGLETQAVKVAQENGMLEQKLRRAEGGSSVELEAKRKLNYKRKDESVFVFYAESSIKKEQVQDQSKKSEQSFISNPVRWFRYFFPIM